MESINKNLEIQSGKEKNGFQPAGEGRCGQRDQRIPERFKLKRKNASGF